MQCGRGWSSLVANQPILCSPYSAVFLVENVSVLGILSGVARVEKLEGSKGNMASAGARAYNGGLGAVKLMAFFNLKHNLLMKIVSFSRL